jgi:hypothetical protein
MECCLNWRFAVLGGWHMPVMSSGMQSLHSAHTWPNVLLANALLPVKHLTLVLVACTGYANGFSPSQQQHGMHSSPSDQKGMRYADQMHMRLP